MFSVAEYGILNLITSTLFLWLAIAKLGIQHSIIRFYGEVESGRHAATVPQYLSTTLIGMAGIGLLATILWAGASQLIPSSWWSNPQVSGLFLVTAVLLFIRTVDSALVNFLRAEERSGVLTIYNVAKRYGTLALVLFTLFYFVRNLYGYFWATIVAESIAVALLLFNMNRSRRFAPSDFSGDLFRRMLIFGMPMIAFELSGIVLEIGARYVIEAMLGSEALGIFSAGYNFCQYLDAVFLTAFSQAIVPAYTRVWESKGSDSTAEFLRTSMHYCLLFTLPMIAGISVVGRDMIIILASEKYAEAADIIPLVVAGMAMVTSLSIFSAGLYLHKRTSVLAGLMFAAAAFNIALNYLLIPHFGIFGSAIATFAACTALAAGSWWASKKLLTVAFPWRSLTKFSVLSVLMYFLIVDLSIESRIGTVALQIAVGSLLYSALVLVTDRPSRQIFLKLIGHIRTGNQS